MHFEYKEPGIRSALVDKKTRKIINDFIIEGDLLSTHVLNVVSPGYTCCIPFSRFICDNICKKLGKFAP